LTLPTHAAILGSGGSGTEEFARLLARQSFAHSGSVFLGDNDLSELPDSVTGRRIGIIGRHTFLRSGSIYDALVYPLLRRPATLSADLEHERAESMRAGNSSYHAATDWIDFEAAACKDENELHSRMIEVLGLVKFNEEVYEIGLKSAISPERSPDLAAKLLEARAIFRQRLHAADKDQFIESFDAETYNTYATVAENIIFGTPVGSYFAVDNLGRNEYMQRVIEKTGLTRDFLEMGRKLAAIKAEIFEGLSPDHEFFERFSFIHSADMPAFKRILLAIESNGIESLGEDDRGRLMALPFRLVETQHQVGLINGKMKKRLLEARRVFAQDLPENLHDSVQFLQEGSYSAANSVAENIIFGKTARSIAGSTEQIGQMLTQIIDELDLREEIISVGLDYQIGIGGSRLTAAQQQKIALARCLIKQPDILIMNDALSSMDLPVQESIVANIKTEFEGRSLILFESSEERRREFEKVLLMDRGKIKHFQEETDKADGGDSPSPALEAENGDEERTVGLNEIVTLLMDIPLFADIDRSKLKLLAFTGERLQFNENQEVFHQGDPGHHAYVIVEGEVDVVLESRGGESTVATLGSNEFFGEMALLSKIPRTTTIRAKTPLVLLRFSQDVFLRLVDENSKIARAMMRVLAERLAATLHDYSEIMAEK
jgi:ABC-type sulfate/molybdate transport systems ATPase subunit